MKELKLTAQEEWLEQFIFNWAFFFLISEVIVVT